jgi:hypothetical protein
LANGLDLPLTGNAETLCPQTGQKYVLRDGYCSVQDDRKKKDGIL